MADMVNISLGNAVIAAILGYAIVFVGLVALMWVIQLTGKFMTAREKKAKVSETEAPASTVSAAPAAAEIPAEPAPGTAGQLKLYDTDPRDAAMVMAIVADTLGKPLNELRFISIREVKEDEV